MCFLNICQYNDSWSAEDGSRTNSETLYNELYCHGTGGFKSSGTVQLAALILTLGEGGEEFIVWE
jgi:hypothetical protein